MDNEVCAVLKKVVPSSELIAFADLLPAVQHQLVISYPSIQKTDKISKEIVLQTRRKLLEALIQDDQGDLDQFKKQVLDAIQHNQLITEVQEEQNTFGERLSDKIAEFGGSWAFIISFIVFMLIWISINVFALSNNGFDPYPFILLNLILSCLAALQAPIIMMSQNRQEQKDRKRAENDYKVNLKAELEVKSLNEKIDYLIFHQNRKLQEIQQLQTEYLDEIVQFHRKT